MASGPLGEVRASPAHVYQLFANLIRNCVKHCKSEHPVIEITLAGEGEAAGHRYMVRDNGEGIPAEDLSEIFKPFFKGSGGGTGIGLATVKKIVNLYGGSVRAYNNDGACFEFALKDYNGGPAGSNE